MLNPQVEVVAFQPTYSIQMLYLLDTEPPTMLMNVRLVNLLLCLTVATLLGACLPNQKANGPSTSGVNPAVAQDQWVEFTSRAGGYTALFPRKPSETAQTSNSPDGKFSTEMHTAQVRYQSCQLGVMYSDYPEGVVLAADPQQALDGSRDAIINNLRGKLLGDKKISLGGHPGRDIKLTVPDGSILQVRLFLVKRRMYQALTISPGTPESSRIVERFLDSFKLTQS